MFLCIILLLFFKKELKVLVRNCFILFFISRVGYSLSFVNIVLLDKIVGSRKDERGWNVCI